MKRYEGLFILNTAGREEGIKEMIDAVGTEIESAGGKIETVQKMEKKPFARVANRKYPSGFYVNIIFNIPPAALTPLNDRFRTSSDVFRVMFTEAPVPAAAA